MRLLCVGLFGTKRLVVCFFSDFKCVIMELGIDSFAAVNVRNEVDRSTVSMMEIDRLLTRIEWADKEGLDAFAIGEHHREEYLDSANAVILAAAAARTKQIKLVSAVTVLSAADPVRVFQQFATLDLISKGRVEIVAGRGSFIDAYSLFGLNLDDYDALFAEKLDLLLKIRDNRIITWTGRFRAPLRSRLFFHALFNKKCLFG
jgi:alkanesulfonate monooxygenase SsuD/methylene tetrahydromethanopterin reductase-like flavin-dependent oxidoreductase (luciferase family)